MKPVKASDYPELRRVFSGYLHEDFPEEHGTPSDALRAFHDDADPVERRRFAKEVKMFLKDTEALDFNDVKELFARLGARWTPASRQALVTLLRDVTSSR